MRVQVTGHPGQGGPGQGAGPGQDGVLAKAAAPAAATAVAAHVTWVIGPSIFIYPAPFLPIVIYLYAFKCV